MAPTPRLALTQPFARQGPCTGNQQSLAHSRLWDAVVGFLHVFAHMMMKLAQVRAPPFFTQLLQGTPQLARFHVLPHRSLSHPSAPGMFQTGSLPSVAKSIFLLIGSLCLTPPPPFPPPIGWFPIHTSIGLTFGPAPSGLELLCDWLVSFLSDEVIRFKLP